MQERSVWLRKGIFMYLVFGQITEILRLHLQTPEETVEIRKR